jgi:hypothetical protein
MMLWSNIVFVRKKEVMVSLLGRQLERRAA